MSYLFVCLLNNINLFNYLLNIKYFFYLTNLFNYYLGSIIISVFVQFYFLLFTILFIVQSKMKILNVA